VASPKAARTASANWGKRPEACGSARHWGGAIRDLGHEVRLIPPMNVKPFVKRQKNDAADSEAIAEAASRPTMRFASVKTEECSISMRWTPPAPQERNR
jgi:transposase